jgi:hypothetical protein
LRNKPFGERVEGLSHCEDKTCAIEAAVPTDDFEDPPLGGVIDANARSFHDLSASLLICSRLKPLRNTS